ncbi:HNH endonuclease [Pseudomonas chlororaphis]|uniref:HNH endonuclease signature motif containing protein n=1 Tax=Pseudomonas chlororaphis TaxID=587753 RepID=UPI001E5984E9|nr:HNH endonuclease signature motif containing protein [Pseudomonas chlororaphis]MCB2253458.1 HNH endonuclease [Pseudomonas chlororaphis]
MPIAHEDLKRALRYDPDTGSFIRLVRASNKLAGSIAGYRQQRDGYMHVRVFGKTFAAHRLAWFYMTGEWPEAEIDHINRVRTDNRWENLRCATRAQNAINKSNYSSNVHWDGRKGGRWYGAFRHNGKLHYAGSSRNKEEALQMVARKRLEIIGSEGW